MDLITCIETRRSGRFYTEQKLSKETIMELITLGTKAATGSYQQPWAFVLLQDQAEIDALSEKIKEELRSNMDKYPHFKQYENWLTDPNFHVFNSASTVVIIYGNTNSKWYVYDCSLAASNIMLAAHSMDIGTCWIGFAQEYFNNAEFKKAHNVPDEFELVCPLSMGYASKHLNPPKRKPPVIFYGE